MTLLIKTTLKVFVSFSNIFRFRLTVDPVPRFKKTEAHKKWFFHSYLVGENNHGNVKYLVHKPFLISAKRQACFGVWRQFLSPHVPLSHGPVVWGLWCATSETHYTAVAWGCPGKTKDSLELNLALAAELKAGVREFLHRPYTLLGKKNQSPARQITKMPDH